MGFSRHMFVLARQALSQGDLTLSVFCCDRQLSTTKYLGVVLDSNLINLGAAYGTLGSKGVLEDRSHLQIQQETQHWCKRQYYLSVTVWRGLWIKRVLFVTATISKKTPLQTQQEGGACHFQRPTWTHTEPLLREMKLCSIDVRSKLKLLIHTYRCTHALASSLLSQQYTNLNLLLTAHTAPPVLS